jgi:hypothetical protein
MPLPQAPVPVPQHLLKTTRSQQPVPAFVADRLDPEEKSGGRPGLATIPMAGQRPRRNPGSVDDGRFNDVARHEGPGESASSCATTAQTDKHRAAVTRRRAAGCLVALPTGHRALVPAEQTTRDDDNRRGSTAGQSRGHGRGTRGAQRAGWGRGLAEERRVPGQKIGAGAHRVSYLCATPPPA